MCPRDGTEPPTRRCHPQPQHRHRRAASPPPMKGGTAAVMRQPSSTKCGKRMSREGRERRKPKGLSTLSSWPSDDATAPSDGRIRRASDRHWSPRGRPRRAPKRIVARFPSTVRSGTATGGRPLPRRPLDTKPWSAGSTAVCARATGDAGAVHQPRRRKATAGGSSRNATAATRHRRRRRSRASRARRGRVVVPTREHCCPATTGPFRRWRRHHAATAALPPRRRRRAA